MLHMLTELHTKPYFPTLKADARLNSIYRVSSNIWSSQLQTNKGDEQFFLSFYL